MGNPYTEVTVANYNTSPPTDDGAQTAANEVEWAKHKDKLGDPLKTAIESTQTNITAAFAKIFGNATFTTGTNHTVTTGQQGRMLEGTATLTFTLLSLATAGVGFVLCFSNTGTGTVTVDPESAETINGSATVTLEAGQWILLSSDSADWTIFGRGSLEGNPLPRSYLAGLAISNGTDTDHDIDIAVGEARDTADTANLEVTTAIGKQLDVSWAAGGTTATPTGGLSSTLTIAADTTYHMITGLVSGSIEVGFDTSVTGANLVTDHSFTNVRRIGSVVTDGSSNILRFFQVDDYFFWHTRQNDVNASSTGTSGTTRTLTVPTGFRVVAQIAAQLRDGSASTSHQLYITDLDGQDNTPSATLFTCYVEANGGVGAADSVETLIRTNTSGQIRSRNGASAADIFTRITTIGWLDQRGKNG